MNPSEKNCIDLSERTSYQEELRSLLEEALDAACPSATHLLKTSRVFERAIPPWMRSFKGIGLVIRVESVVMSRYVSLLRGMKEYEIYRPAGRFIHMKNGWQYKVRRGKVVSLHHINYPQLGKGSGIINRLLSRVGTVRY